MSNSIPPEKIKDYEEACASIMKGCLSGANEPSTLAFIKRVMDYADLLESLTPKSCCQWVRADDRLPDFINRDKKYVVRYIKIPDELQIWNWDTINEYQANSYSFEWLDESTPCQCSKYKEALEKIARPIDWFHNNLKEGERLDGVAAIQLSNDANWLKTVASESLNEKI